MQGLLDNLLGLGRQRLLILGVTALAVITVMLLGLGAFGVAKRRKSV